MYCRLGFTRDNDGQLLVLLELLTVRRQTRGFTVTRFSDESAFLYYVVLADLAESATTAIVANVLLALSDPLGATKWTLVEATDRQLRSLGLSLPRRENLTVRKSPWPFLNDKQFRDVFTQAPTPITLFLGPRHKFAFINPAYLKLLRRQSTRQVMGKPIREALPELHGQPFFGWLDKVYRTGEPFLGTEVPAYLMCDEAGGTKEFFFDFVYHPVRDRKGAVRGILAQASDVTERVLARNVSDARELQLYQQWAELEAIYKAAPVGMALVDARSHVVLRLNDHSAGWLGVTQQEMVGRRFFDVFPEFQAIVPLYERVAAGEAVRHVEVELVGRTRRCLRISLSPVRDACGRVEAIASVAIDCNEIVETGEKLVLHLGATAAVL